MIKFKKLYVLVGLFILLASSSLPALSVTPMSDTLGESFSNNFGLVFDLNAKGNPSTNTISTDVQVMQDLGNPSNPKVNTTDARPNWDQQFFFSHFNKSGVSNIYLALEKMEFDIILNGPLGLTYNFGHVNGSAPFQTLLQYFHNNGKDVLVANTFRGLVAYSTNSTDQTLDSSDNAYFGYSFVEQHLIDVLNSALTGHAGFNAIPQYGFTPIYDPGTMTFGMNYTNYLVAWQSTSPTAPSNISTLAGNAFSNVITGTNLVAASVFKYLSFTYHVEEVSSNATTTIVKVVTNYDLGPMELLITGDTLSQFNNIQSSASASINSSNSFHADNLGWAVQFTLATQPYEVDVSLPPLSFYTGAAVESRIDANAMKNAGVDGLGIAVASSTNAIVLGSTVNAPQQTTNSQNVSIPLSFGNNAFFKTDFAGKSTYTRTWTNGTTENNLPIYVSTRSMSNLGDLLDISNLASTYFDLQSAQTLGVAVYSATQLSSGFVSNTNGLTVDNTSYVTFVQMPKWSGLQVTQDPSFSAVSTVAPPSSNSTGTTTPTSSTTSLLSGVPGFEYYIFIVAVIPLYAFRKRKNSP